MPAAEVVLSMWRGAGHALHRWVWVVRLWSIVQLAFPVTIQSKITMLSDVCFAILQSSIASNANRQLPAQNAVINHLSIIEENVRFADYTYPTVFPAQMEVLALVALKGLLL